MATMSIRISDTDKSAADSLFKNLGITTNAAINMFLKQCIRTQSLIFTPSMEEVEEDDIYKFFTKKELEETAKELKYIKTHLNEYKENNKWEDLLTEFLDD